MHSQFLTNMFNQSRWKAKAGGYCELMCLHMIHLGLSSRADSRLRSGLHKIEFCCPKRADEMSLLGDAGLLPWLGEEIVFSGDYRLSHYSPCPPWEKQGGELCFSGCPTPLRVPSS